MHGHWGIHNTRTKKYFGPSSTPVDNWRNGKTHATRVYFQPNTGPNCHINRGSEPKSKGANDIFVSLSVPNQGKQKKMDSICHCCWARLVQWSALHMHGHRVLFLIPEQIDILDNPPRLLMTGGTETPMQPGFTFNKTLAPTVGYCFIHQNKKIFWTFTHVCW